jgi:hypothetical protein
LLMDLLEDGPSIAINHHCHSLPYHSSTDLPTRSHQLVSGLQDPSSCLERLLRLVEVGGSFTSGQRFAGFVFLSMFELHACEMWAWYKLRVPKDPGIL